MGASIERGAMIAKEQVELILGEAKGLVLDFGVVADVHELVRLEANGNGRLRAMGLGVIQSR